MCLCFGFKPHSHHEVINKVKDDKTIAFCCIPHRGSLPVLLTIQLFATIILLIKSDLANFQLVDSDFLPDGNLRDYTVLAPMSFGADNTKNSDFELENVNSTDSDGISVSEGDQDSELTNPTPLNIRINREITSQDEEYEDLTVSNEDFHLIDFNATEPKNSSEISENSTKSFHQITFRDYAEKSHKMYNIYLVAQIILLINIGGGIIKRISWLVRIPSYAIWINQVVCLTGFSICFSLALALVYSRPDLLNWTNGKQQFWECEYNGWDESTLADYGVDYEETTENSISFGDQILNGVYGTTEDYETTKPVTDSELNPNSDDVESDNVGSANVESEYTYIAAYQKSSEYNISEPCGVLLWFKSTVKQNWSGIRGSAVGYCVFFMIFGFYQSWLYRECDFYGSYCKQLAKMTKEENKRRDEENERRAKHNQPLLPKTTKV